MVLSWRANCRRFRRAPNSRSLLLGPMTSACLKRPCNRGARRSTWRAAVALPLIVGTARPAAAAVAPARLAPPSTATATRTSTVTRNAARAPIAVRLAQLATSTAQAALRRLSARRNATSSAAFRTVPASTDTVSAKTPERVEKFVRSWRPFRIFGTAVSFWVAGAASVVISRLNSFGGRAQGYDKISAQVENVTRDSVRDSIRDYGSGDL